MKDLIDALPGIDTPVGKVTQRLNSMWEASAGGSPSEFRASQMNVVLHFGWEVSAEEAAERFNTLIQFAQRYPSRIIVLCPCASIEDGSMRAKLFSQCYIGDSHREMCCCEALILGYQPDNCGYLGNQVSVWLESDLPTYHWFNRVPADRIRGYFDNLLVGVRRSIYDSSIEPSELTALDWPEPGRVRDLAEARLLPVRQAIGQFLSGYAMHQLCRGLESVTITHAASMGGEGRRLMEWIRGCLADCGGCGGLNSGCVVGKTCAALQADYAVERCDGEDCLLTFELRYEDDRRLRWKMLGGGRFGRVEASLGKGEEEHHIRIKPLGPAQMIAEALLF